MATSNIFVFLDDQGTGITFANSASGPKDKELTTAAKKNGKVKWKVKSSEVEITGITMKDTDIWSTPPTNTNGWEGTISDTAPLGDAAYGVNFKINGGSDQYQDPKINVKDGGG